MIAHKQSLTHQKYYLVLESQLLVQIAMDAIYGHIAMGVVLVSHIVFTV